VIAVDLTERIKENKLERRKDNEEDRLEGRYYRKLETNGGGKEKIKERKVKKGMTKIR
jgi:hypothetical protein